MEKISHPKRIDNTNKKPIFSKSELLAIVVFLAASWAISRDISGKIESCLQQDKFEPKKMASATMKLPSKEIPAKSELYFEDSDYWIGNARKEPIASPSDQTIETLNLCLDGTGHRANMQDGKFKIFDADGLLEASFACDLLGRDCRGKIAGTGTKDFCTSIGTLAEGICNNGISENRDDNTLRISYFDAARNIPRCPETEEDRIRRETDVDEESQNRIDDHRAAKEVYQHVYDYLNNLDGVEMQDEVREMEGIYRPVITFHGEDIGRLQLSLWGEGNEGNQLKVQLYVDDWIPPDEFIIKSKGKPPDIGVLDEIADYIMRNY